MPCQMVSKMRRSGFCFSILFFAALFSTAATAQVACPDATTTTNATSFTQSIKARPTDGQCLFQTGSSGMVFSAYHAHASAFYVVKVTDYDVNLTSFSCAPAFSNTFGGNTWESRINVVDGPTTCTFAGNDAGGNPFSGQLTAHGYDAGANAIIEITNMSLNGPASVFAGASSGTLAADQITEFMGSRSAALLGAQPDILGLLGETGPSVGVLATKGQGSLSLRSGNAGSLWVAAEANWGNLGTATTSFALLSFGSHVWLNENTILGGMIELDRASRADGVARLSGSGYLIGPYFASQGSALSVDARLLYGQSANRISPTGTYTDSFASKRWLASFNLTGQFKSGRVTFLPGLGLAYTEDQQQAYVNGLAVPVPAQKVQVGEFTARMNWQVPLADDLTRITGGLSGIMGWQAGSNAALAGARGRLDLGLGHQNGGFSYGLNVWLDGLGRSDLMQRGLEARLDWSF